MLDPQTAKNRRYLIKHLFSGNESQYLEWLNLYKQAVEGGSKIPFDVAMIKFREKYVQSGKYWSRRIHEGLEEGGPGSGNFGHAGRPGAQGGSGEGGGEGGTSEFEHYVSDLRANIPKEFPSMKSQAQGAADVAGLKIKIVKVELSGSYGRKGGKQPTENSDVDIKYFYKGDADVHKVADVLAGKVSGSYGTYDAHAEKVIESLLEKGTTKSGNYGHAGIPGEQGGSKKGTGGKAGRMKHVLDTGELDLNNIQTTLAKIYANWRQDDQEKMVLIAKDGTYIVVGTGTKGGVDISMTGIQAILKDNGQDFHTLQTVIHNHDKGEAPSATDIKAFRAFMDAGFAGDYQIYTPLTTRIQNTPYSEGHESLREGGPGSGNFQHAGRPGEVGGSGEGGSVKPESGFLTGPQAKDPFSANPRSVEATKWARDIASVTSEFDKFETNSLLEYRGTNYGSINKMLRGIPSSEGGDWNKEAIMTTVNDLDLAMKKSSLNQDVVLYRGLALSKLKLSPGTEFVDNGFVSCSTQEKIAKSFMLGSGQVLKILVPEGTPAVSIPKLLQYSTHSDEHEIILNREITYRVESTLGKMVTLRVINKGHGG